MERRMNKKGIAICCVGDFSKQEPSPELLKPLALLIKSLMDMFGIPLKNIKGHRDFNSKKTCPGKRFGLDVVRKMVKSI